jgi:predicted nucleotidyltransferase
MTVKDLLKSKRQEILRIAALHGASNIRIFGSESRGEAGPKSDLDLLVGCKVDVVTESALHWYIKDRILAEAVPL